MAQLGYANFSNQRSLKNILTKTRMEVWPKTSLLGNPSNWQRFDKKQRLEKQKLFKRKMKKLKKTRL